MSNELQHISKEVVSQWCKDAQLTLNEAKLLCSNAQSSLHEQYQELTIYLPDKFEAIEYLIRSYTNQLEKIKSQVDVLNKSIYEKVEIGIISKFQTILDPSLKNLNDVLSQSKEIDVPNFILEEPSEMQHNLSDFVSISSINLLIENIGIYKNNSTKLKDLLKTSFKDRALVSFDNFQKVHVHILEEYAQLAPIINEAKSKVTKLLEENQSVETELVQFLQMLTNHYQQCEKALDLMSSNEEDLNLEVLANDVQELPQVIKDLKSTIQENQNSFTSFQSSYTSIDLLKSEIMEELTNFRNFKTKNLPFFITLFDSVLQYLQKSSLEETEQSQSPIDGYSQLLNRLTFHYTQFINIYKTKYLKELHHQQYSYPRKFLKRITDFLDGEIYRIQLEEINHRKSWILKYGEFLPKEFKLPGESELPSVVQVVTEGLEYIQYEDGVEKEFNQGEEKFLLDLIKKEKG
ncbi:unnamed protein product [Candida verbasci]|uniref:Autophagy-related protein 17 n=1 Tax=Candida verbasci TaxID=1227364 RepID=A0A9W4XE20_9ASCO|nr:unnamed protein product [Candida verbasci]